METLNLRMPVHAHPKAVRLSFIVYLQCMFIFFHLDVILSATVCLQCLGSFEQFLKSCEIKILNALLTQLQCLVLAYLLRNKRTKLYFSSDLFQSNRDSFTQMAHPRNFSGIFGASYLSLHRTEVYLGNHEWKRNQQCTSQLFGKEFLPAET